MNGHEVPRFIQYLTPEEQKIYNAALLPKLQLAYEAGLHKVYRWKDPKFTPYNPDFTETDLDHVEGCLDLFNSLMKLFPSLQTGINQSEVRFMLIGHDGAEIITGDVSLNSNSRETALAERKKRQEPLAMQTYLLPHIRSPYTEKAARLMQRWFVDDPHDHEVQIGHLIDKLHGALVGIQEVFPYSGTPEPERLDHMYTTTLVRIHQRAFNLYQYSDPLMHSDLSQLIYGICDRFKSIGFPDQAARARQDWEKAIKTIPAPNVVLP